MADVKGMEAAKRAVEVAAAGAHNLLLVGPPGAGKSMLACRLPGLLPDLTPAEALEVSTIHSVAGMLTGGLMVKRPPYREPHHSRQPGGARPAAGSARGRARSASRIAACCSWTSCRSFRARRWKRCAHRSRPGGPRWRGRRRTSPTRRGSS